MISDVKWPTDSLYKFICVFGLSMFLAGSLLYWSLYKSFTDSAIRSEMALTTWTHQLESSTKAMEAFGKKLEAFLQAAKEKVWDKTPKLTDVNAFSKFDLGDPEAIRKSVDEFIEALKVYRAYRETAYSMITAGLVMSAIGGYFWYTRIQRYEDQIIRGRAKCVT